MEKCYSALLVTVRLFHPILPGPLCKVLSSCQIKLWISGQMGISQLLEMILWRLSLGGKISFGLFKEY